MTENQEKEQFTTLSSLVTGVNTIQSDVKDIKVTLSEHSLLFEEHSRKLDHLVSKTDSTADQVLKNDTSLSARVTAVERSVEDLGGKIN